MTTTTDIWRPSDNPAYPGIPIEPENVVARSTSRATVDYPTYVRGYAARLFWYVFLMVCGAVGVVAAAVYTTGVIMVIAVMIGIGLTMASAVACMAAVGAHDVYTRYLAVSTSETYEPRRAAPPPATVRPFVASSDGDGRTINTGQLNFEPQVWQSLFNLALANGGVVDKENVCRRAGIGRRWYHTDPNSADGYRAFQAELRNIGFIDQRNRLTDTALAWYAAQIPLPLDALPSRTPVDRPTADRPPTDRPNRGKWGGGEGS